MRKIFVTLLSALGLLVGVSEQAFSQNADPAFPFVYSTDSVGLDYSTPCLATRLHGGICYWWAPVSGVDPSRESATFRVVNRAKICMDSDSTSATVQVVEYVTPSAAVPTIGVYKIVPGAGLLNGTDCLWLSKGEYWLRGTASAVNKTVVSLREVPE